ncbi:MAG: hypothetical protein J5506_02365 [Prevotella sp.]|nr:hypothetical protein [Prevotella sp.]
MKKIVTVILLSCIAMGAWAQKNNASKTADEDNDLWTRSLDVPVSNTWRTRNISVPGKGTPDVVTFLRAYAKVYPHKYYTMLLAAIDGDERVKFNHEKPSIHIDKDRCSLSQGKFSMRVFYNQQQQPMAIGIIPLAAITHKVHDAYFFRYDARTRMLKPYCQASDFTSGIRKRIPSFSEYKNENDISMNHFWGRCGLKGWLRWNAKGNLVYEGISHDDVTISTDFNNPVQSLMFQIVKRTDMELRDPQPERDVPGGSILSLPICVALRAKESKGDYAHSYSMEGYYYFYIRGWHRQDGTMLAAVAIDCAADTDFKKDPKTDKFVHTPHKLAEGDEVNLQFYDYNPATHTFKYIDPKSPKFAERVASSMPTLDKNQWRCKLSADNDKLIFRRESDGKRTTYVWNGNKLVVE